MVRISKEVEVDYDGKDQIVIANKELGGRLISLHWKDARMLANVVIGMTDMIKKLKEPEPSK